jgi:hypothetical protein
VLSCVFVEGVNLAYFVFSVSASLVAQFSTLSLFAFHFVFVTVSPSAIVHLYANPLTAKHELAARSTAKNIFLM